METSSLPFRISGLYGGCAKLSGLVILSAEELTLEYRLTDSWVGAFNGQVTRRSIAWAELERAECGLGFFCPWLALEARTLSTFDRLPCSDPCRLKIRVAWKNRRQLRALTSEINLHLSFRAADRLRDRMPRLPGAAE